MFVKLTNMAEKFNGEPLVIKKDVIISVYSGTIESPDAPKDSNLLISKTYIYSANCSWEVRETVDQVFELLNK
jgi:hypothetical protein